jgi:hypothetical protein
MDRRKKAKRGGERKHGEEIGFRLSALIEGVRDSVTPSAPTLTIAHGSHDFNAWQPSRYPRLFPHLTEFKAPGGCTRVVA